MAAYIEDFYSKSRTSPPHVETVPSDDWGSEYPDSCLLTEIDLKSRDPQGNSPEFDEDLECACCRNDQQVSYKSRNIESPSPSYMKSTGEVVSADSLETSNGFAANLGEGTECAPSKKSVSDRKFESGSKSLTESSLSTCAGKKADRDMLFTDDPHMVAQSKRPLTFLDPEMAEGLSRKRKSLKMQTCSGEAEGEAQRTCWTKSSSAEHSGSGSRRLAGEAEEDKNSWIYSYSNFDKFALPGSGPGTLELDLVSLQSILETIAGSEPKESHSVVTKGGNSRPVFYEPDSGEDGEVLKTKDDLFLLKQSFDNDEVSDEVFAKSSPPSPVKPVPGREEDVLLRSSSSKGGRKSLKVSSFSWVMSFQRSWIGEC